MENGLEIELEFNNNKSCIEIGIGNFGHCIPCSLIITRVVLKSNNLVFNAYFCF